MTGRRAVLFLGCEGQRSRSQGHKIEQEPQGALIAHLSTMRTSVKS